MTSNPLRLLSYIIGEMKGWLNDLDEYLDLSSHLCIKEQKGGVLWQCACNI